MRILELSDTLDTAGAERMVATLALELATLGQAVHLIALRDKGIMPVSEDRLREAGVRVTALNKTDGFSPRALAALVSYVRRHRIEVVHTHNHTVHHYGALAARLGGARAVVNTVHGFGTLRMQPWAKPIYRLSCSLTDRVVSVCAAVDRAARATLHLKGRRAAVIYNGIEAEDLLAVEPRRPDGRFVFGTMGRLSPVKDHHNLLEAFARVQRLHPHSRLEILGRGELRQDLERFVQSKGLEDVVDFRGFSLDLAGFLSRLDCFVLSSKSEGLPLSVLEAMAAGVPVVSTAVGGVPELIRGARCGWLCAPERPADLSAAMEMAMASRDRERMGARARASVLEDYSVPRMARNYLDLFSELLPGCVTPAREPNAAAAQKTT